MALVAKLIPKTIETALMAFFTGLNKLNLYFIGRLLGNLINSLTFKVTKEDLSKLWILHLIQAICSLLPLLIIWLIPTPTEVKAVQSQIQDDEKALEKENDVSEQQTTA